MYEYFHVCYEGGAVDMGFSRLAAEKLALDDTLPGPEERAWIAVDLLREAADDGILRNIWGHAGLLAIAADYPEVLTEFLQSQLKE